MEHGLACIGACIHNHPVPALSDPLFLRQLLGHQKQLSHQIDVVGAQVVHRGNVFRGDNKDVGRGLGADIPKRDDIGIGSNQIRRDLPVGNSTKKAIMLRQGAPPSSGSYSIEVGQSRDDGWSLR